MPKKVAPASEGTELLQLDPAIVLADDNTRFNLKEARIQSLADSIISQGGVIQPVEVEPVSDQNGFKYRLTAGFYRHAAVKYLNTTQAAGLTLPATLHVNPNPTERLKRQMAENMERENQSPMDQAIAIKKLLDVGVEKIEVRQMFSRPGGRKGGKVQPASNSFVNMTLSFLELPKGMQEKIHDGRIGVAAAYQLTKVPAEDRAKVLERAESDRQRELEREEKEEEKLLTQQKKESEAQEVKDKLHTSVGAAETKHKQAHESLEKQTELVTNLFAASKKKFDTPKDKKAAESAFKEAEKQRVILEADELTARKELEKLTQQFSKHETLAQERAAKLKEARASSGKKGAIGPEAVKKAAKDTGSQSGHVALSASEMRAVVADIGTQAAGSNPKVVLIGQAFQQCFAGAITDTQLYKELVKIVS